MSRLNINDRISILQAHPAMPAAELCKIGTHVNYGNFFRYGCDGTEMLREEGVLLRRWDAIANASFNFFGIGLANCS